jgi:hypothetical protein
LALIVLAFVFNHDSLLRSIQNVGENKRWVDRFPVDLKVRFGQKILSDNGRVQDISMFGFFIETPEVFPKGASLKVQLLTPEKKFIQVRGVVQWSTENGKNKSNGDSQKPSGMGIEINKFLEGRDIYKRLCQENWKKGAIEKESPDSKIVSFKREG